MSLPLSFHTTPLLSYCSSKTFNKQDFSLYILDSTAGGLGGRFCNSSNMSAMLCKLFLYLFRCDNIGIEFTYIIHEKNICVSMVSFRHLTRYYGYRLLTLQILCRHALLFACFKHSKLSFILCV